MPIGWQVFSGSSPITTTLPSSKAHQKSGSFPPPALPGFNGRMTLSELPSVPPPVATLRPLPSPVTGLPRLPEPPFRRAVLTTPADRAGARADCFPAHAAWLNRSLGSCTRAKAVHFNSPGAIAERAAASSVLRHPLGTPADGAVKLQSMYHWFVGLSPDDAIWDPTTFTKNRHRLVARHTLKAEPRAEVLVSYLVKNARPIFVSVVTCPRATLPAGLCRS